MKIRLPQRLMVRLMLLTCLGLVAAIALQAAIAYRQQTNAAQASAERRALAIAGTLASAVADDIVAKQFDALDNLLAASVEFDDALRIQISDTDGLLLSHFVKRAAGQNERVYDKPGTRIRPPSDKKPSVQQESVSDGYGLVAWHPVSSGVLVGWVAVQIDSSSIQTLQRSFLQSAVLGIVLATTLASLMIYLALKGPVAAITQASQFAKRLEQTRGEQLAVKDATLEISMLSTALNLASTKLHQQHSELSWSVEQLRKQEAVLVNRTEQLDAIFNLNPDGLVTLNAEHRLEFANPAFLAMMGWTLADLRHQEQGVLEQRLREVCLDEGPLAFQSLDAMSEGQTPDERKQIVHLKGPDKRVLQIKARRAQSKALSQILYFRDITYEAEVDRLKSEFLAHAAHELRTPLTSIHGFGELLLQMDLDAQTQRDLLETIYRHTGALVKIVNELLDIARIEGRGTQDMHFQALDLGALTQAVIKDLDFDRDRWPLEINLSSQAPSVFADPDKLRQALLNVLNNAQKYSPQGGPIRVSVLEQDKQVGVEIRDHGIGLTPSQLEQIGQRFWRADKSGNIPGTGLGVGIVREILALHGGRLEIQSQHGQGSSFILWLPVAEIQPDNSA